MTRNASQRSSHRSSFLIAATLLVAAVGCTGGQQESFSVSLKNESAQPVTVWLTKTGRREDVKWLAPEDLSASRAAALDKIGGVVIPPGKTGEVGPVSGVFEPDSLAMLRVYGGQLKFDQLLATPPDGMLRIDIPLREGLNRLRVAPRERLVVQRIGENGKPIEEQ